MFFLLCGKPKTSASANSTTSSDEDSKKKKRRGRLAGGGVGGQQDKPSADSSSPSSSYPPFLRAVNGGISIALHAKPGAKRGGLTCKSSHRLSTHSLIQWTSIYYVHADRHACLDIHISVILSRYMYTCIEVGRCAVYVQRWLSVM